MAHIPSPSENIPNGKFGSRRKRKGPDLVLVSMIVVVLLIALYVVISSSNELEGILSFNNSGKNIINYSQNNTNNMNISSKNLTDGNSSEIQSNNSSSNQTGLNKSNELEDGEVYLFGLAISQKNYSYCSKLVDRKQDCYEALAGESEDACLLIENYSKKKNCINNFVESENSTDLCSNLNETDKLTCGLLVDSCYGKNGVELEKCNSVKYYDINYCDDNLECIYNYAYVIGDLNLSFCYNLSQDSHKLTCVSLLEHFNHCSDLALPYEGDYCNYYYSTFVNDSYFCSKINKDNTYSYKCYLNFALGNKDYTLCNKIGDLNSRWICLKTYAVKFEDINACKEIDTLANSNYVSCFFNLAVGSHHPSTCDYLDEGSARYSCYAQSFLENDYPITPESCENISSESWRDNCYKTSAVRNDNSSICNLITGDNTKQICLSEFE